MAKQEEATQQGWLFEQWRAVIESFAPGYSLQHGGNYYRKERVSKLKVSGGLMQAQVQGSESYHLKLTVPTFKEAEWQRLAAALRREVVYAAKLLAGQLSAEFVAVAAEAQVPFLPGEKELNFECDCLSYYYPCKHAVAAYYALGEQVDHDPFTLFVLRGKSRKEVLDAIWTKPALPKGVQPLTETERVSGEPLPSDPAAFWQAGKELAKVRPRFSLMRGVPPPFRHDPAPAFWPGYDFASKIAPAYRTVSEYIEWQLSNLGEVEEA